MAGIRGVEFDRVRVCGDRGEFIEASPVRWSGLTPLNSAVRSERGQSRDLFSVLFRIRILVGHPFEDAPGCRVGQVWRIALRILLPGRGVGYYRPTAAAYQRRSAAIPVNHC